MTTKNQDVQNSETPVVEVKASFLAHYYGSQDTTPISTSLVDQKIAGAVSQRSPNLPNENALAYTVNRKRPDMFLNFITKSPQGKFNLNTLFPMSVVNFPRGNSNTLDTVNVYVAIAASSGKHQRNVGTPEQPQMITAYANGNIGNFARMFESLKITGCTAIASISQSLIPASVDFVTKNYFEQIQGKDYIIGTVINRATLNTWKNIRAIQENLSGEYESTTDKEAALAAQWEAYQDMRKVWVEQGYLVESNIQYAIENGVKNTNSAELGFSNASAELNASSIYGTEYGMASYLPDVNRGYMTAILTDAVTDSSGKFHYGTYPAANIRSQEDLMTLTDPDEIKNTPEITTRELMITDGAGNNVLVSARMRDTRSGSGSNRTLNKRSRAFADIPVGSQILIIGCKVAPKYSKEGTQAIRFELSDLNYKVISSASSNLVVGDLTSVQDDTFQSDGHVQVLGMDESIDDFDLSMMSKPLSAKPAETKDTPVVQTTAKSDDQM